MWTWLLTEFHLATKNMSEITLLCVPVTLAPGCRLTVEYTLLHLMAPFKPAHVHDTTAPQI